jgi:hypothetical protein
VVPTRSDRTDSRRRADSVAAEARRRAADSAAAADRGRIAAAAASARRLLCEDQTAAEQALRQALAADVSAQLSALYQPRDANDTREKTTLLNTFKDVSQLRVTAVGAVRNETAGDACDWLMTVDFAYITSFGGRRTPKVPMRMRLEPAAGGVRVRSVFGATAPR